MYIYIYKQRRVYKRKCVYKKQLRGQRKLRVPRVYIVDPDASLSSLLIINPRELGSTTRLSSPNKHIVRALQRRRAKTMLTQFSVVDSIEWNCSLLFVEKLPPNDYVRTILAHSWNYSC